MKKLFIFSVTLTASDGEVQRTATITAGRSLREAAKALTRYLELAYPLYDATFKLEETRR